MKNLLKLSKQIHLNNCIFYNQNIFLKTVADIDHDRIRYTVKRQNYEIRLLKILNKTLLITVSSDILNFKLWREEKLCVNLYSHFTDILN